MQDKIDTLPKFKSPPSGSLDGRPVAVLYKMAAIQEKSFCVLEYVKYSPVSSVQRAFLHKYGKAALGHQSVLRWFRQFRETGCVCKGKSTGRLLVSEEIVERVRQSFVCSPQKSTVRASHELGKQFGMFCVGICISNPTVCNCYNT
ncbi:hypothetical protein AVEN_243682-1 [Araneus ventricosus]|uniref:Uncharacterized protein n=1 Tax=Araneus ventricosus TaxID=182803 RepID=A0A4Y2A535_ARAVE|nr:hypothetical protein AVEN_243682-1 [Araneus ventricosus]